MVFDETNQVVISYISRTVVPGTYVVIRRDDGVPNLQLAVLQLANVEHIAIVDLNILNLELCVVLEKDAPSVVFLAP